MKTLFAILCSLALTSVAHAVTLPPNVEALHKAMTQNVCDDDAGEIEMHVITKDVNLYIVPCYRGAYQMTGNVYLDDTSSKRVEPVQILTYSELVKGVVGEFNLGNPEYDPKTKILWSSIKGRGMADCGESSQSKVIAGKYGVGVKTVEIRHKAKCDGRPDDWPVVFRQK